VAKQSAQAARGERHERHEGGDQRHAAPVDRRWWWAEGFTGDNGWLIEGKADPGDHGAQDWADAQALYAILEQEVVPAFYERDHEGMPKRWLQIVKQSIRTVLPRFSARRMVKEYVRDMYVPAMREAVTK
jgi:starch phosphorylase